MNGGGTSTQSAGPPGGSSPEISANRRADRPAATRAGPVRKASGAGRRIMESANTASTTASSASLRRIRDPLRERRDRAGLARRVTGCGKGERLAEAPRAVGSGPLSQATARTNAPVARGSSEDEPAAPPTERTSAFLSTEARRARTVHGAIIGWGGPRSSTTRPGWARSDRRQFVKPTGLAGRYRMRPKHGHGSGVSRRNTRCVPRRFKRRVGRRADTPKNPLTSNIEMTCGVESRLAHRLLNSWRLTGSSADWASAVLALRARTRVRHVR